MIFYKNVIEQVYFNTISVLTDKHLFGILKVFSISINKIAGLSNVESPALSTV